MIEVGLRGKVKIEIGDNKYENFFKEFCFEENRNGVVDGGENKIRKGYV